MMKVRNHIVLRLKHLLKTEKLIEVKTVTTGVEVVFESKVSLMLNPLEYNQAKSLLVIEAE